MATAAAALIGGLSSIFGGIGQGNQEQWQQAAAINMLNHARATGRISLDRYNELYDYLRGSMGGMQGAGQAYLWGGGDTPGQFPQVGDALNDWRNNIIQLFRDSGQYITPEMEQAYGGMLGAAGGANNVLPTAAQLFLGGGWSEPGYNLLSRGMDIGQGRGYEMGTLADVGAGLLGSRGMNQLTGGLTDRMFNVMDLMGRTPGIDSLSQAGLGALSGYFGTGGLTPTGAVGEGVGLQGLLQGGATPETQYLQSIGATQAGDEPLLSMDQVVGMARSEAAQRTAEQAEAARRFALARGGGPAALTQGGMGGAQGAAYQEFADKAIEEESRAIREALLGQQGLQLQRQAQGGQMALQAADQERARLATYAGLLGSMEDVASRRFGIGGGLMGDAERTALQRELGYGNLGINAGELEANRMGLGGNLLNMFNQTRLGGLGAAQSALSSMNQMALGGGGLYNQLLGTQGSIYDNLLGNYLAGGTLGMNRARNIGDLMTGAFGQQNQLLNNILGGVTSTYNPFTSMANQAFGTFGNLAAFNPFAAYGGYGNQPSPGGGILGGIGDVIQGIGTGIGRPGQRPGSIDLSGYYGGFGFPSSGTVPYDWTTGGNLGGYYGGFGF